MTRITEQQNPLTKNIDKLDTLEILSLINREDQSVPGVVEKAIPVLNEFINEVISRISNDGSLFYIGSGTSGRLGILDAVECVPTFSAPPHMVQGIIAGGKDAMFRSIEGAEDDEQAGSEAVSDADIGRKDIILGIAASSTTPFVISALKSAKDRGAFTGLVCGNRIRPFKFLDILIPIVVGPEVITGSTRMKAGTATKLVLNMITTTTMIKLNKTYGNLMVDLKASNQKLWDRGARLVSHFTGLNNKDAGELLISCRGEVKTAIVVDKLKTTPEGAREILKKAGQSLRKVIG